ncbi:MAG: hypothetical protein ACOX6T_24030 [Myxococcales bacterium]|jgi:hypothetical protein
MLAALLARLEIDRSDELPWEVLFGEPQPRHVLSMAGLRPSILADLEERGCLVGTVPCAAGLLFALRRDFDAVVVRPDVEDGLGLVLVRALKLGASVPGLSERFLEPLRRRVAHVPFWITPFPDCDDYGLVLSGAGVMLRRQADAPMVESICRLKAMLRAPAAEA